MIVFGLFFIVDGPDDVREDSTPFLCLSPRLLTLSFLVGCNATLTPGKEGNEDTAFRQ